MHEGTKRLKSRQDNQTAQYRNYNSGDTVNSNQHPQSEFFPENINDSRKSIPPGTPSQQYTDQHHDFRKKSRSIPKYRGSGKHSHKNNHRHRIRSCQKKEGKKISDQSFFRNPPTGFYLFQRIVKINFQADNQQKYSPDYLENQFMRLNSINYIS